MYLYLINNIFHSDSNKLVESLIVIPSPTNLENNELSKVEENVDDMLVNQSKLRTRKRKERRKKQYSKIINGVKSPSTKEQNRSISE